jgi:D-alanyl-D-alanine carboxypeptidase/D-alanyl-D-alanine-endopeptidase (penicillin-binding protein 4)
MRSTREARSRRPIGRSDYREPREQKHGPGGPSSKSWRPTFGRHTAVALGALALLLALSAPAGATLRDRLTRALHAPGVSWSATGAWAYDLDHSRVVYRHNARLAFRPASNEKVTVAVTALDRLGPQFRIPTEVLSKGVFDGAAGVLHGPLFLKGYGDPWLRTPRLEMLVAQLRAAGIRKVTGRILGDESYFDRVRVGPGWKPSFYKVESPPLSALVVNRGHVGRHMWDQPARAAAFVFRRALRAGGIAAPGDIGKGVAPADATVLVRARSRYLTKIVRRMDHVSDNFFAEMLLKQIGKKVRGEGTTKAGAAVVRAELRQRGVTMTGVRIADGSGLSLYDRLTARALGELLISATSDNAIGPDFVASLPIAGVNGTLEDRMERLPAYRHVFAKTGTTELASALSGYVRTRFVFSILQNGSPIPYYYARQAQDRFAQVLAGAAQ